MAKTKKKPKLKTTSPKMMLIARDRWGTKRSRTRHMSTTTSHYPRPICGAWSDSGWTASRSLTTAELPLCKGCVKRVVELRDLLEQDFGYVEPKDALKTAKKDFLALLAEIEG